MKSVPDFRVSVSGFTPLCPPSSHFPCVPESPGALIRLRDFHPKGRLTDEQAEFIAEVIRNRGVAFVAWSIDDVDRELDGLAG